MIFLYVLLYLLGAYVTVYVDGLISESPWLKENLPLLILWPLILPCLVIVLIEKEK